MADPAFTPHSREELETLLAELPKAGLGRFAPVVEGLLRTALHYEEGFQRWERYAGQRGNAAQTYREKLKKEAIDLGISVHALRRRRKAELSSA